MDGRGRRSIQRRSEPAGRWLRARVTGSLAAALAIVGCAVLAAAPAGATSGRSGATAGARVVRAPGCTIAEHAAFRPAEVVVGRNAHLVVVLRNCTDAVQAVDLTRYGQIACIVADPVAQHVSLAADKTKRMAFEYRAPSCTGSGEIAARVTSSTGRLIVTRTATLKVLAPPAT